MIAFLQILAFLFLLCLVAIGACLPVAISYKVFNRRRVER